MGPRAGYCGGSVEQPTYEQVCRGHTGHAEAVEVEFDPGLIGYQDLLDRFWSIHNPTTRNRQGWDLGTQYRSAIFTTSGDQLAGALAGQSSTRRAIVTDVMPAGCFWPAEEYHQQYLEKRGRASCAISIDAA